MDQSVRPNDGKREEQSPSGSSQKESKTSPGPVVYLMCVTTLLSTVGFSLVMSSLWPFMKKLDPNSTETLFGWLNSAFSIAQLLSSLLFGFWLDRRKAIEPLILNSILLIIANVMYTYAGLFGKNGIWILLASRISMGIAAGNIVIARAVVANASTPKTLTRYMSYIAMCQSAGMFVGPIIQAATIPLGSKELHIRAIKLDINIFTLPSIIMAVFGVIILILVIIYFEEEKPPAAEQGPGQPANNSNGGDTMKPIDLVAITVCILLFIVPMAIVALNETYTAPVMMAEYAYPPRKTLTYAAILLSICGVIASISIFASVPLSKRFGDRRIILIGMVVMIIAYVLYLPFGPGYPKVTTADLRYPNGTAVLTTGDQIGGCSYHYDWCVNTPKLALIQYVVGTVLSFSGFPVAYVVTTALYAKIIGPFPKGKYMGLLSGFGGLARIGGPVYVTSLFQHFGPRWTAIGINSIVLVVTIIFLLTWKRIIPYNERYPDQNAGIDLEMTNNRHNENPI